MSDAAAIAQAIGLSILCLFVAVILGVLFGNFADELTDTRAAGTVAFILTVIGCSLALIPAVWW